MIKLKDILQEETELKKSDVQKVMKLAKKIEKDITVLSKLYKSKIYDVSDDVLSSTYRDLEKARQAFIVKAMGGLEFIEDKAK
jgi:hypothetical protein|tara:strand:+ start:5165 stop:5413 length:249 start_codon:yes stop_codon:yes gene_type:complete